MLVYVAVELSLICHALGLAETVLVRIEYGLHDEYGVCQVYLTVAVSIAPEGNIGILGHLHGGCFACCGSKEVCKGRVPVDSYLVCGIALRVVDVALGCGGFLAVSLCSAVLEVLVHAAYQHTGHSLAGSH